MVISIVIQSFNKTCLTNTGFRSFTSIYFGWIVIFIHSEYNLIDFNTILLHHYIDGMNAYIHNIYIGRCVRSTDIGPAKFGRSFTPIDTFCRANLFVKYTNMHLIIIITTPAQNPDIPFAGLGKVYPVIRVGPDLYLPLGNFRVRAQALSERLKRV